ncbi:zinc ribbon domain-containing protein [Candidatus Pacearchaeota archaeon]|nr:zinc ribbon domain-containing protein [Candidatus Pacearchaeota archaeon]
MPVYEYRCKDCNAKFEVLYRQGDEVKCECGSENLEKLVSTFALKITGTHFVGEKKIEEYECDSCEDKKCEMKNLVEGGKNDNKL